MNFRTLYRDADGHAWAGEWQPQAVQKSPLPAENDARWVQGKPAVLDTQWLTLAPFYPTGRLDVSVELKTSQPLGQYPNHPAFEGCHAWMPLDAIVWEAVVDWNAQAKANPSRPRPPMREGARQRG